jgi:hypothetical protein
MVNVASKPCPDFLERFNDHAPVNRAVVDEHNQSLSIRISPLPKEGPVERPKNVSDIICVVDFGTRWEPIIDMEPMWVPHDCQHALFALDIGPGFY